MIKKCTCNHPAQDALHGKNMRVMNDMKEGKVRCTVCKAETKVHEEIMKEPATIVKQA